MAGRFPVLRILADPNIHQPVVNHRSGDDIIFSAGAAQFPHRIFGIAVEFPDQLAAFRNEGIEPAVAAGEDHLGHAADFPITGIRPGTVEDILARRIIFPYHLAGMLIERQETGRAG